MRQKTYAAALGSVDLIVLSRERHEVVHDGPLTVYSTNSRSRARYGLDAMRIAKTLPSVDVVTAQDPFEVGLLGFRVARRLSATLHVQLHTDPLALRGAAGIVRRVLARFVLRRAARIRVVSERAVLAVRRLVGEHVSIAVLPIFVDTERFARAEAPQELRERFDTFSKKFLFVGRLEKEKNAALAIRSFVDAKTDACLIIVGEGSERPALESLARELGVQDCVFFEGQRDAVPYYAFADLVLVSSHYEGYGLVIVEALAAGKPVLATDVGIAREAGAIVTDEVHFAEALRDWLAEGSREGKLLHYPYASFQQYVDAYAADIAACVKKP